MSGKKNKKKKRKREPLLRLSLALVVAGIVLVAAAVVRLALPPRADAVPAAAVPASAATTAPDPTPTPAPTPTPSPTPRVPSPPEITLLGEDPLILPAQPAAYVDPGCTVWDEQDGDLTEQAECVISVDPYRAGEGQVAYTVTNSEGLTASAVRRVIVTPVAAPEETVPEGKIVYLTFDDGPSENTDRLLAVLDSFGVKATWFVTCNQPDYLDRIRDIAERGHTVAVHSASHRYEEIYASEDAFFADFREMQDVIYEYTGERCTLLRFPGGSSNTVSRFNPGIMTSLVQCVNDMGITYFDWNVTSADTASESTTYTVIWNVCEGIAERDCSVVLMHDIKAHSVDAVAAILRWGLRNGYTFLPLDSTSPGVHHPVNN